MYLTRLLLISTVSMAGCALFLTLLFYLSEALYFRTCTFDFYVIFPTILNCNYANDLKTYTEVSKRPSINDPLSGITLIGLLYIPKKLRIWEPSNITYPEEENGHMFLKKMNGMKKRRKNNQNYYQPDDQ